MPKTDVKQKIKPDYKLQEPPMYKIIYINDDKTTMDFVVETLIEFFNYQIETAEKITIDIHQKGSAVVAVLPFELAEQKGVDITIRARSMGFPLQIKLEPESD